MSAAALSLVQSALATPVDVRALSTLLVTAAVRCADASELERALLAVLCDALAPVAVDAFETALPTEDTAEGRRQRARLTLLRQRLSAASGHAPPATTAIEAKEKEEVGEVAVGRDSKRPRAKAETVREGAAEFTPPRKCIVPEKLAVSVVPLSLPRPPPSSPSFAPAPLTPSSPLSSASARSRSISLVASSPLASSPSKLSSPMPPRRRVPAVLTPPQSKANKF